MARLVIGLCPGNVKMSVRSLDRTLAVHRLHGSLCPPASWDALQMNRFNESQERETNRYGPGKRNDIRHC